MFKYGKFVHCTGYLITPKQKVDFVEENTVILGKEERKESGSQIAVSYIICEL